MAFTLQAAFVWASLTLSLASLTTAASSGWTLTNTNFNQTSWETQPYVSNGYIGQRLPAEGIGYYQITPANATAHDGTSGWPLFDPRFTASIVAGFYDQQPNTTGTNFAQTGGEQPISTLPTWSSILLTLNGTTYNVGTPLSQISNWSQSLSIENGVVTTLLDWAPSDAIHPVSLKFTTFAHRTRPNLGVVRLDASNLPKDAEITVTDLLDGAGSWRTNFVSSGSLSGASDTIYTAVQPDGISNVTAYLVSHLTTTLKAGLHTTSSGCASSLSKNESTVSACYSTEGTSSGKLTAIKYVGIASSDAFPGTELQTASHTVSHASSVGYSALLSEHTKAWAKIWESADIIIPGEENEQLQLATRASLFHLLTNVREGSEGHGLGDNSIAPAGLTSDSYAGQVFWDADTWMAPSLLALFPSYAESITNFRYRQLGAAQENSLLYNRTGALYPWTAARFGNCTGVGPCYDYEYHLENDIALLQYQYYAATQNRTWLETKGWPVISSIAEFWASQVVYNSTTGKYDTFNETDPDEYANFRNNAAFTNAGIAVTLHNAISLAEILGVSVPSNWSDIAQNITILTDESSDVTLEYDGFNGSTAVKQADVVLLTYPLEYTQDTQIALNDLDYYALATSPNGPGMTYSIYSIDASALSPIGCASWTYLLASSQPYSRAPFYQFSEQTTDDYATNGGTNPAFTFLTGHGGFLQSFTHGFTGYRSRLNALYLDPILPPQLTNYTIKGMKWNESTFDIVLTTDNTTVIRRAGHAHAVPVEISSNNAKAGNYTLKVGQSLVIPTRHTNGTLVEGNLAQCKSVISTDTDFHAPDTSIVPGQYALSAIDGSNATAWQPLSNASATLTVDLHASQTISGLQFNWGNNPPTTYVVFAGDSLLSMTQIAAGNVSISTPYDAAQAEIVTLKTGNVTETPIASVGSSGNGTAAAAASVVKARYLNVTIAGSYDADGRGGTLAEFVVL